MEEIEYQVLEHQLLKFYLEIQENIPKLHNISFNVSTYETGKTSMHGYFHVGGECESFRSADELISLISNKEAIALRRKLLSKKFK